MTELVARLTAGLRPEDEERFMLQRVQPALIGLIDGTVSTLAPIFATAFIAGSRAALLVGMAAALGAAISMGLSEALSDDGSVTGRGTSLSRGMITGIATFFGGSFHALPFLISDLQTALTVAYATVAVGARDDRLDPEALPRRLPVGLAHPGDSRWRHRRRHRRVDRKRLDLNDGSLR